MWQKLNKHDDDVFTGGLRKASASVTGQEVYRHLKFEVGVHRVQRVPQTEKSGRIHTSTMTVAVLPQPTEVCCYWCPVKTPTVKTPTVKTQTVKTPMIKTPMFSQNTHLYINLRRSRDCRLIWLYVCGFYSTRFIYLFWAVVTLHINASIL